MEKCTTSLASKNASALVRHTGAGGDIAGRKPLKTKARESREIQISIFECKLNYRFEL